MQPLPPGAMQVNGAPGRWSKGLVQTPGVSHFFGCHPLGPVGWTIAGAASAVAAGASIVVPRVLPTLDPWLEPLGASLGSVADALVPSTREMLDPTAAGAVPVSA